MPEFTVGLPWAYPRVPEYKLHRVGKWTLTKTPRLGRAIGYWHPEDSVPPGYVLRKRTAGKYRTWMSLTPMELQSHQPHIAAAKGNIIVGGLGMGMYLFNILAKPEVENVMVVERDEAIVDLFSKITNWQEWPGAEKLQIRIADITNMRHQPNTATRIDFLYMDIWERLGTDLALPQTKLVVKNLMPRKVGYWGQEFDYASFLMARGLPMATEGAMQLYEMFLNDCGLPLVGTEWPVYPVLANAAVAFQSMMTKDLSPENRDKVYAEACKMLREAERQRTCS